MRFLVITLALLAVACGGSSAATPSPSQSPTPASHVVSVTDYSGATYPPKITPAPTPSASPIPIDHPAPYTIAVEAGHGGPFYFGASARDSDGNLWIEKDLTLSVATRVSELLAEAGYNPVMLRPDDSTLTQWNPYDYRGSMIAETQARVNVANEAAADLLLSIHFNGWHDASQHGTEAYCNPDRPFGNESCQLAWFVEQSMVQAIRGAGYDDSDRGVKNDGMVNGDPNNLHSYVLGTNDNFSPSLMPGAITEVLFLSNPEDLAFLRREDAIDVIAKAFVDGVNQYLAWLNGG